MAKGDKKVVLKNGTVLIIDGVTGRVKNVGKVKPKEKEAEKEASLSSAIEFVLEKEAKLFKSRKDFPEYDSTKQALKHIYVPTAIGTAAGAGLGALAGKKSKSSGAGAAIGAGVGSYLGAGVGQIHQNIRDTNSAKARYGDDKKAVRQAVMFGPQFADWRKKKRDEKKSNKEDK